VKFLIQFGLVCGCLLSFLNPANAQVRTNKVIGYIQSEDVIRYSQVEAQCVKNDPNQMRLNFIGGIETVRISNNIYQLTIMPIDLNTPLMINVIRCQIILFLELEPRKFLRFRIMGSIYPMSQKELSLMIDNQKGLTSILTHKLNRASLIPAETPQRYILKIN
jgi:hypothetical protein